MLSLRGVPPTSCPPGDKAKQKDQSVEENIGINLLPNEHKIQNTFKSISNAPKFQGCVDREVCGTPAQRELCFVGSEAGTCGALKCGRPTPFTPTSSPLQWARDSLLHANSAPGRRRPAHLARQPLMHSRGMDGGAVCSSHLKRERGNERK